jgi:hypothetical protein
MNQENKGFLESMDSYKLKATLHIEVDRELEMLLGEMEDIKASITNKDIDSLADNCKNVIIDSIMGPFGLSRSMFEDKDGGNVTTINNAINGTFANQKDQDNFNRVYNEKAYREKNENFRNKKKEFDSQSSDGNLRDVYNSERSIHGTQVNVDKNGDARVRAKYDTEHIVSAHEIHNDPRARLFMNEKQSTNLANDDKNLGATLSSLNQSKQDKSYSDWADRPSTHDTNVKNAEAYGVNRSEAEKADREARKKIDWELKKAGAKKYSKELAMSGAKEGFNLGMRQAIGLILREMTDAVFTELRDIFKNGNPKDLTLGEALKQRFERVRIRVQNKWKDALVEFKDGAINGFISNFITFIINNFITTVKRTVTIIREGFNSLIKAIKLLVNPPENMTKTEAAYEASKIIAASVTTIIGLFIEESVQKFLESIPFLNPIASFMSPVITGILTGIATVLVVYSLDQLKGKIELKHQQQVLVSSGVLTNQYKTLQTLIMLDKSVYFSKQMNHYISEQMMEIDLKIEQNRVNEEKGEEEFYDLLHQFKLLNQ